MAQRKIYYNVSISYNPDDEYCKKNILGASIAKADIRMKEPLIDDTGDYTLSISKFKIDTSGIPFMIPEMQVPQPTRKRADGTLEVDGYPNGMVSIYKVKLGYNGREEKTKNFVTTSSSAKPLVFYKNKYPMASTDYFLKANPEKPEYMQAKENPSRLYVKNTDPQCYVYNYAEFVERLNSAIEEAYDELLRNPDYDLKNYIKCPYFKICSSGTLDLYIYAPKANTGSHISIGMSAGLYHYLDPGISAVKDDDYWWITNKGIYLNNGVHKLEIFDGVEQTSPYAEFSLTKYCLPYNPLLRWGDIKSILITSAQLPVAGEFIPAYPDDGFLRHHKTNEMLQAYKDVYDLNEIATEGVFERGQEKIVDVFYPLVSAAGDMRTQVVFNNQDIENGNKIDLIEGSSIQQFDLQVKWMDIHGNVHPLLLPYGCGVDIRFVFSRRHISKEHAHEEVQSIISAINKLADKPEETEDDRVKQLKKKRVRLNNELIPMYGHDMNQYGYIEI